MSKSYSRIFWGLVLIIIGVLMFLKQFGIIYFHWYSLWQLWPLLLIFLVSVEMMFLEMLTRPCRILI